MAPVYMFTSVQVFATVFPLSGQQPKSRVVKFGRMVAFHKRGDRVTRKPAPFLPR